MEYGFVASGDQPYSRDYTPSISIILIIYLRGSLM